jgi:signal transduction histidine kinase/ActR/RegA family two-component response regulator
VRAEAFAGILAQVGAAEDVESALRSLVEGARAIFRATAGTAYLLAPYDSANGGRQDALRLRTGSAPGEGATVELDAASPPARLEAGEPAFLLESTGGEEPDRKGAGLSGRHASSLHVPIERGGLRIGSLHLERAAAPAFSRADLDAAARLALLSGGAVWRAWAQGERERFIAQQAARRQALSEFARAVGSTLDLDAVCRLAVEHVAALTGAVRCVVLQHVPREVEAGHEAAGVEDGGAAPPHGGARPPAAPRAAAAPRFRYRAVWHRGAQRTPTERAFPARVAGQVHGSQAPLVVADTRASDDPAMRDRSADDIRSVVAVPVAAGSAPWGVLNASYAALNAGGTDPAEMHEQVAFLAAIAAHLGVAVHNAELFAQLRAAHEELARTQLTIVQQERLRALGQLAAGIAHDLNNTLAPVIGFADLLLDAPGGLDDEATVRRSIELIRTGAEDAAAVVDRLREFYRQRGEAEVFLPVDLARVAEAAVAMTRPRWYDEALSEGRAVRMELDARETPPVAGHQAELREALTNLVLNAVDALEQSGTVTVRVRPGEPSGGPAGAAFAVLEVADTGAGMPEEVRRRCLEPFFTTKGEKGTGLGLALVHATVQRHGGRLEIESAPGRGTTVRLWLPCAGASAPAAPHRGAPPGRPLSVLVVDDDARVRGVTAAYLRADAHRVREAGEGAEALEAVRAEMPDLVVTDLAMPGMAGDELAATLKRLHPELPVILLTGFGGIMAASGQAPPGVDHVVGKPVTMDRLRAAVRAVTAGKRSPTSPR